MEENGKRKQKAERERAQMIEFKDSTVVGVRVWPVRFGAKIKREYAVEIMLLCPRRRS